MATLSKVNEQKDNVLAPNTTLSLSETPARGIREGVGFQDSGVHKRVCFRQGKTLLHLLSSILLFLVYLEGNSRPYFLIFYVSCFK